MECRSGLSEERGRDRRRSDGRLFQVETLDRNSLDRLLPLLWETAFMVNGEDIDAFSRRVLKSGEGFYIHGTEQYFFDFEGKNCEFRVASIGNSDVGLLVSQWMGGSILYVRTLYVKPEHEGLGIGQGLVEAASPSAVVFRTRQDIPPENLMAVTSRIRRVCRSENFDLWHMNWGKNG